MKMLRIGLAALGLALSQMIGAIALPNAQLEVVATLPQGPGNIAVIPDGRIIISNHQFYDPQYRVLELHRDGSTTPFPTPEWSQAPNEQGIA